MLPLAQTVHISEYSGFFVGWWTLSMINAGLAQSKNRSGLFWWLVSVPLGPVATFIIVALLDKNYAAS
jgi:hypothetical protein